MTTESVFPSMVLAAYTEALIADRRVIVFGDSTSGLAETLLQRGARLVHVFDGDLSRVAEATARGTSQEISYAPLGQSGVAVRDGAFDFGIIENLAASEDPASLVRRLRRALAARGVAVIATPNLGAQTPLLRDGERVSEGPTYYDLYDWVSSEFDEVKMLGQLPFVGYAVADFGTAANPDFCLDTAFLPNGAEEPDWYLALASHFPVNNDAFSVIQIPRSEAPQQEPSLEPANAAELEEVKRKNVQLEAEVERLRKAERQQTRQSEDEALRNSAKDELSKREAKLKELTAELQELRQRAERAESRSKAAQAAEAAQAQIAQAMQTALETLQAEIQAKEEQRLRAETAAPQPATEDPELLLLRQDLIKLERQLEERGREFQRVSNELKQAEVLGAELLVEVETMKERSASTASEGETEQLTERLRRAEGAETRRVADLVAAQWTIEQLLGRLRGAEAEPPTVEPGTIEHGLAEPNGAAGLS